MQKSVLKYLVCPVTKHPLKLLNAVCDGDKIIKGLLVGGQRQYHIEDGIPSFASQDILEDQTVRSFTDKWNYHKYYREHTDKFYSEWYLDRYSLKGIHGLRDLLEDCRFVLDVGTGSGRDAVNFYNNSSAIVFALDTAREALLTTNRDIGNPRLIPIHADASQVPFPDNFFDFINCDQVIHHLPDPQLAFERLGKTLKTGGHICCYVYRRKAIPREYIDDYVREILSQLPLKEAQTICEGFTQLGRALSKLDVEITIEKDIEILGIVRGTYPLQRFFHYNIMKCFWNDGFDFFTNNIVNVDWYHPEYCYRYEPDQFLAWFDTGWEIQSWDVREAGISCRAKKV